MADLRYDPRALREQRDQFQVDLVDPLAQLRERSAVRRRILFSRSSHRGKGLTDHARLFNFAAPRLQLSPLIKSSRLQSRFMKAAPIAANLRSRILRNSAGLRRASSPRCAASAAPTAAIAA